MGRVLRRYNETIGPVATGLLRVLAPAWRPGWRGVPIYQAPLSVVVRVLFVWALFQPGALFCRGVDRLRGDRG
jgi:hypothetical protein